MKPKKLLLPLLLLACGLLPATGKSPVGPDVNLRDPHSAIGDDNHNATLPVSVMDGVTDQTDLLQRTIDALPDGGVLALPAGTMILSRPVLVRAKSLTLRGAGAFATRLRWVAKGGMDFSDTRTWNDTKGMLASWEISDIQFEAGIANAGTALLLAPQSARLTPSVFVHNCNFQPAAPRQYWNISIDVRGGHLGRIAGCYFRGNPDPQATTSHHIKLSGNSTSFTIENCHGEQSIYGILVEDETEGALISKCFFVQNAYGYVFKTETGGQPMFDVCQSHAASSVYPLWIKNARSSSIAGNLLVLRGDKYESLRTAADCPAMVRIEGGVAKDISITGNALQMNDKEMKQAFVGIDVAAGRNILITGNTIAHNFASGAETGIRFSNKTSASLVADNIINLKDNAKGVAVAVSPEAKDVVVRNPFAKTK